jgi:hypothetical protein
MLLIRIATLRTAAMIAALSAAAPAVGLAASGGNIYAEAQEQRDVASLHRDATLQPRPPEEEITQQASRPSLAVDCGDPANANSTVCSPPR